MMCKGIEAKVDRYYREGIGVKNFISWITGFLESLRACPGFSQGQFHFLQQPGWGRAWGSVGISRTVVLFETVLCHCQGHGNGTLAHFWGRRHVPLSCENMTAVRLGWALQCAFLHVNHCLFMHSFIINTVAVTVNFLIPSLFPVNCS